jgi:hypothetical protein
MRKQWISVFLIGLAASGASSALSSDRAALTQDPLVMRLNKDEFRIAFGIGIDGQGCGQTGCSGSIRYRVEWTTADGTKRSEVKQVGYSVSPLANRTIAVDRQYFDTAEGAHQTEVLKVRVDRITCRDGVLSAAR